MRTPFVLLFYSLFWIPLLFGLCFGEDASAWLQQEFKKSSGGKKVKNRMTSFSLEGVSEEIKTALIPLRRLGLSQRASDFSENVFADFQGTFFCPEQKAMDVKECTTQIEQFFGRFERIREAFFKLQKFHKNQAWERKALVQIKLDFRAILKTKEKYKAKGKWWVLFEKDEKNEWKIRRSELFYWKEGKSATPHFKPVTEAAGLKFFSPSHREIMGLVELKERTQAEATHFEYGGLIAGDYNQDKYPDLFVPNVYGRDLLYRNNQDGTFTEVGRDFFSDTNSASRGAVFGDIDNDGDQDLFVTRSGFPLGRIEKQDDPRSGNAFFLNENGKFINYTQQAGLQYRGHSFTPLFFDYDNDGDLDLYVSNYANKHTLRNSTDARNGEANLLYENMGNATFKNVTKQAGVGGNGWSFAVATCDYDNDGDQDLYVANDFGRNVFYENLGNKTFRECAVEKQIEDFGYGMGAVFGDYNNDQNWDLYVSNMHSGTGQRIIQTQKRINPESYNLLYLFTRGNSLFQGLSDGKFAYKSKDLGVNQCGWAWHADFFDYNYDGYQDLFVLNGYATGHSERDY